MDFWSNAPSLEFTNEATVETRFVIPLLRALGYEDSDVDPKAGIVFQEGRVGRRPEADFLVFHGPQRNRDTSLIVVEAKAPTEPLTEAKVQAESYALNTRAPFLLLTNGIDLEIWQMQVSMESKRILNCALSDLNSYRGQIEATISKRSAYEYCKSLAHKTIHVGTKDFAAYETAELQRTIPAERSTRRTLKTKEAQSELHSDALLSYAPAGAIVVGPSGFGKTTLCKYLLRQAISDRWEGETRLPVEVPLPELFGSERKTIFAFVLERISAHCPQVTDAVFKDTLRKDGLIVLLDSFDRLSFEQQREVETGIRLLARDYPKLQFLIFSRDASLPNIDLAVFVIDKLNWSQQVAFCESLGVSGSHLHAMPRVLRELCSHPLLLKLTLDYRRQTTHWPAKLELLFDRWLNVLIERDEISPTMGIVREQALTIIAEATATKPMVATDVLCLLKDKGLESDIYDQLIACDAINADGGVVGILHEALADYLRAKSLLHDIKLGNIERIEQVDLEAGSFLPILVMSLLPTRALQRAFWKKLSNVDWDTYVSVVRYRGDISQELRSSDAITLEAAYLEDLLEGFEFTLEGFFPSIRSAVLDVLELDPANQFGLTGRVSVEGPSLLFGFNIVERETARIRIGSPEWSYRSINLGLSGLRLDSGRVVGVGELRKAVTRAFESRTLEGGRFWRHERLVGRLRYLVEELAFQISLEAPLEHIKQQLLPHISKWVTFNDFSRTGFLIGSLIEDIDALKKVGLVELDLWWQRLGWEPDNDRISNDALANLAGEMYRRGLAIYREVAEASFGNLLPILGFYPSLPVRWKAEVWRADQFPAASFRWSPVRSTEEEGVDSQYVDRQPQLTGAVLKRHFDSVRADLIALGRYKQHSRIFSGSTMFEILHGRRALGELAGELPSLTQGCKLLKDDLEGLFRDLPDRD